MRKIILLSGWLLAATGIGAQTTPLIPYDVPSIFTGTTTVQGPFDIFSPYMGMGPVVIYNTAKVDFVAGNRIHLQPGFQAGDFSSDGYFHAQIGATPDFDVVFIEPNSGYPQVGLNEKLEMGIRLPATLASSVQSFLSGVGGLNPFDPDEINMQVDFSNGAEQFTSYGFYYQEFVRDPAAMTPMSLYNWFPQTTTYDWRVRFAPRKLGIWTATISIYVNGSITPWYQVSGVQFECIPSDNPGFLEVGRDNRHLRFSSSRESFFAIGQNIAWCGATFRGQVEIIEPYLYADGILDLHDWITSLADNRGNFVRFIVTPQFGEIEWGALGDYSSSNVSSPMSASNSGLTQAWELDQLINLCEAREVYLMLNLAFQGNFRNDTPDPYGWDYNPLNVGISGIDNPRDIYEDAGSHAQVMKVIHNRHRYYLSRWGYSTSIGVIQLYSEFDGWDGNGTLDTNPLQRMDAFDFLGDVATDIKNDDAGNCHLISTSFAEPPWGMGLASTHINSYNVIDLTAVNRYHNERTAATEYFKNYNVCTNCGPINNSLFGSWDKPGLITEIGITEATDTTNQNGDRIPLADPNDIASCSDITFHNYLWSTAFNGGYGTGLNWWQWFNNEYREQNYPAVAAFFSTVDFEANSYENPGRWDDGILPSSDNSLLETVYLKSDNNNHAIGWAHNMSYWWGNIDETCLDRYGNFMPIRPEFNDDLWSDPQLSLGFPIIEGLAFGRYQIQSYSCRGSGGALGSTVTGWTDIFGRLMLPSPGTYSGGVADYAFKVDYDPLFDFRMSNEYFLDTLSVCVGDALIASGACIETDSLPTAFAWYINDSLFSTTCSPAFSWIEEGIHQLKFEVWRDSGLLNRIEQVIIVVNCNDQSVQRVAQDFAQLEPTIGLSIFPNPATDRILFTLIDTIKTITVFSSQGKVIYSVPNISSLSYELNVFLWPAGVYFVSIETPRRKVVGRFIKLET